MNKITTKLINNDFLGSPYLMRIYSAPDASKVKVMGPGIEHGVLPIYQSHFMCDTKGAGAGQLTVRIRGPKGKQWWFEIVILFFIFFNQEHLRLKCKEKVKKIEQYIVNMIQPNQVTIESK